MALKILIRAAFIASAICSLSTPLYAKNLIYCSEASPDGFDPALYTSGTTNDAAAWTIYNRLLEFNPDETGVLPSLAEKWDISDNGIEYIFHLRKEVKFHSNSIFTPKRDFNADDVIFTFDRAHNKVNPWHQYLPGALYAYYTSTGLENLINTIEKVDNYTVKFTLKKPDASFLATLAMAFISINSKEYADQLAEQSNMPLLNQNPIGTGPFRFVHYQKDTVIRYKANENYFLGKPKIDNLIFSITPDATVRAQKLVAGECHIMAYPALSDLKSLKNNPNIKIEQRSGLNIGYLAYNTLQPPFDKAEIRRALNMAVNKQAIINAVFDGDATAAKNPIPPTMWSYNQNIKDDDYNPQLAKKILNDAGVHNLSMKIWAMPVSRPYMPNARRTAELIQADFAKIGVKADIVSIEWGEYLKEGREKNRDGAMIMGWTGDNGDPDNFLNTLLGCNSIGTNNTANWCYKPYNDLVEKAKIISNQTERTKLYQQAQVIFKEQAPWLTIAHSNVYMPMLKKVTGFHIYPVTGYRFATVDINE